MTINAASNNPRVEYTVGQGVEQKVFTIPFEFFEDPEVKLYVDGTLKTQGSGDGKYTVTGGEGSTGTATFNTVSSGTQPVTGATGGSTVIIVRDIPIERVTDFSAGADINRAALNTQLDTLTALVSDADTNILRTLTAPVTDSNIDMSLPDKATRVGKALGFNSSSGNPEAITFYDSAADVRAAVEAASDSNVFTDADHSKLDAVEANATADQTAAEIRAAVEAATDSNVFTDADHSKLDGIEGNSTADQTASEIEAIVNHDNLTGFVSNEHIDWTASGAGSIHLTNLPATALTAVQTASSESAMLALTTQEGDVVVRSDENKTYMHNGGSAGTMSDFTLLATPTGAVTSVDGATGAVTLNHDTLTGFVANEHIDWTTDQGATNLHAGNYVNTTYAVGDGGLTQKNFTTTLKSKLDAVEASADVTDATNVTAAGALMDSEVTNLAQVKAFASSDYATAAQGTTADAALPKSGGTMTGNIVMSGSQTVDGRDLSVDGAKLDGIEANATADQTASEIRTLVESATDSNVFTDADHSKLNAIEANATADQTASEIKTAYESNSDTNAFTDAEKTKLSGVAASANNYVHPNHSGEVTSTADGAMVIADDVVDEANLKVSNSPTNGYVLTAQSGNTGGLTWAAASGGGGSALTIKEEGTALSTAATSLDFVGAAVTASGTGADKTITIDSLPSSGGTFTGDVTFEGAQYTNRNVVWDKSDSALEFADNAKIVLGQSSDLQIYHNALDSYIQANISGNLFLRNATDDYDVVIECDNGLGGTTDYLRADGSTGEVQIYHYGSEKLKSQAGGVDITGDITVSGSVDGRDIATNIPSSLGTAGQVLTVNSGASAAEWATASGGGSSFTSIVENYSNGTAPSVTGNDSVGIGDNVTVSANDSYAIGHYATCAGAMSIALGLQANVTSGASQAVALGDNATVNAGTSGVALGTSYVSATDAFAAIIANNTSSYGATGSGSAAIMNYAKASSSNSGAFGFGANATNSMAYAFGAQTFASGNSSVCLGRNSLASATYSICIGNAGQNNIQSSIKFSGSQHANQGDAQIGMYPLMADTTDATATAMVTNHQSTPGAGTANQIVLPNNSAYAFSGTIVARQKAGDGTACAAWKIEGLIRREANAGTTVLVNSATTVLDNTPNWGMALSADTTNGGLKVQVTGAASTNIRWTSNIMASELTYA
jgi:hypothetical protein